MTQYEVSNLINDLDLFYKEVKHIMAQNTYVDYADVDLGDYVVKYNDEKVEEVLRLIDVAEKLNRDTFALVSDWKEKHQRYVRRESDRLYDDKIDLLYYILEDSIEVDFDKFTKEVERLNALNQQEAKDYDDAREERF